MATEKTSSSSTTMSSSSTSSSSSNRVPLTLRNFFFQDPFFQTSWDDFERIRQDMMKESQEFWSKAEQAQTSMLKNEMIPSDSGALTPMILPRKWMLPRFLSRDETENMFPSDFFNFKRDEDQVLRVKDDKDKFEVSLDTHEYRPDELKVNVNGNVLSVEAKHEEKGENKFVSRQFSRKYTLPEGCEAGKVISNLSSDGILMITAPKNPAIKGGDQAIPIEVKK